MNVTASGKTSNFVTSEPADIILDVEKSAELIRLSYLEEIVRQKGISNSYPGDAHGISSGTNIYVKSWSLGLNRPLCENEFSANI